jgi:hypothetical protein
MVSLTAVKASNELLDSTLPNLVAVFVGGTSGIGEYSLKSFTKHTRLPRVYLLAGPKKPVILSRQNAIS